MPTQTPNSGFAAAASSTDCRKPESRIYELTLERISEPAESCLFIDDVLVNIEGARKAGLNAVHFQDNEQAIAEIRAALAS